MSNINYKRKRYKKKTKNKKLVHKLYHQINLKINQIKIIKNKTILLKLYKKI